MPSVSVTSVASRSPGAPSLTHGAVHLGWSRLGDADGLLPPVRGRVPWAGGLAH